MKEDVVSKLQEENSRLTQLATHDELTGLYNRRAVEDIISKTMDKGGALLVCDLDNFKHVNDKYGHLMGDMILKESSQLLHYIIRQSDVLGRIGGDEFVIFGYGIQNEEGIEKLIKKIEDRFFSQYKHERLKVSLTIGGAIYREGLSYNDMFEMADKILLSKKEVKRLGYKNEDDTDNWVRDMDQIKSELVEQISIPGAYCQDFESFKNIYRFLERTMRRNNQKACLVLISLEDAPNVNVYPQDKSHLMIYLGEVLQNSLRLGDVYTRYSSCQYLVLLMDVTKDLAEMVAERIKNDFMNKVTSENVLLHYCYELEPAKTVGKRKK